MEQVNNMDRDRLILPGIIIIIVVIVAALLAASLGSNTFDTGNLYFQYSKSWSQDQVTGNFNDSSLFSQVILTANIPNAQSPTSYIIIQMQRKSQGTLQLPGTNTLAMNTTNSTVGTTNVGGIKATQIGSFGPNVAQKVTIIDKGNYYYILGYICPPDALNQTETDYNSILNTLKIQ